MKSEVNALVEQLEAVEQLVLRMKRAATRCVHTELGDEELGWLAAAERRLAVSAAALRKTIEESLDLPELKAIRAERLARLEQDWLRALRTLFDELVEHVGATSPLIEALFPHQRFDRVERPGAAQRAYRAEVSARSASGYVRRMALDPGYPFLAALLAPLQAAERALADFEQRADPSADEAARLRASVLLAGQAMLRSQRQARALAEAALMDAPEPFAELGFDGPRRRAARTTSLLES